MATRRLGPWLTEALARHGIALGERATVLPRLKEVRAQASGDVSAGGPAPTHAR